MHIQRLYLFSGAMALLLVVPAAWAGDIKTSNKLQLDNLNLIQPNPNTTNNLSQNSSTSTLSPQATPVIVAQTQQSIPATSTDITENTQGSSAIADAISPDENSQPDDGMDQVTNVSQLRDVQPGEWAYEALRQLVERYGCIAGYPDGTFRGNRALTRYEFAAGLNACLQQVEKLVASSTANLATKEDLETLRQLTQQFQAEIATLGTRVDKLENRVGFLESHQFSTTTVLRAEVIFGLATAWGGDPSGGCRVFPDNGLPGAAPDGNTDPDVDCGNRRDPANNAVFSHLTRLLLDSSFSGKDRLRLYLTSGNFDNGGFTNPESFNTYMVRPSYQAGYNNQVILDLLEYRLPVFNDRVVVSVVPFGFSLNTVLSANSPYFDTGRGSISRFGEASPIFKVGGPLDAGVGIDWLISEKIRLQVAYGTAFTNDPAQGVTASNRSALGVNLLLKPVESVITGLTYVNAYTSDGRLGTFTGSVNAESSGLWSGGVLPVAATGLTPGLNLGNLAARTNAVGGTFQWRAARDLTLGAWGGFTFTNFLDPLPNYDPNGQTSAGKEPFANTATYLFSLGLSNPLGREGDLLAFLVGMPPKLVDAGPTTRGRAGSFFEISRRGEEATTVTDNNPNVQQEGEQVFGAKDEATSMHFEVFYRFRMSDNVWITPGFFVVTNPGHIANNNAVFVGTLRTMFRF